MSIAGGGKMIFHKEACTEIGPAKLLLKSHQMLLLIRTAEILEDSSMDQRRHVEGIENPADIIARGTSIQSLKESGWLSGPEWLLTDEVKRPKSRSEKNEVEAEQATSTLARESKLDQLSIGDDTIASTELENSLLTA